MGRLFMNSPYQVDGVYEIGCSPAKLAPRFEKCYHAMPDLDQASYCSLKTFRKDGRAVATAVWFAAAGDRFFAFSAPDAGKVKRIRNSARAEVAPCDVRGNVRGAYVPATATILATQSDSDAALRVLRSKYGVVMFLFDIGSKLGGRFRKRAYIQLQMASSPGQSGRTE